VGSEGGEENMLRGWREGGKGGREGGGGGGGGGVEGDMRLDRGTRNEKIIITNTVTTQRPSLRVPDAPRKPSACVAFILQLTLLYNTCVRLNKAGPLVPLHLPRFSRSMSQGHKRRDFFSWRARPI